MEYRSKRTIGSMVAAILILVAFGIYALSGAAPALDDLSAWATVMLVFIGIAIVSQIVMQIVFHIAVSIGVTIKEGEDTAERILKSDMIEDEREKRISQKSAHAAYSVVGGVFLVALIMLAFGLEPTFSFLVVFVSFFVSSLVEGCMSIYLAQRGVFNG